MKNKLTKKELEHLLRNERITISSLKSEIEQLKSENKQLKEKLNKNN